MILPQVKLLTHTPNPIELLYTISKVSTSEFQNTPIGNVMNIFKTIPKGVMEREIEKNLDDLVPPVYLEFFNMVFLLRNVSRAFQQQLTRHRIASYFICSLRVVKENFADNMSLTIPSAIKNEDKYKNIYKLLQEEYKNLLQIGEEPENARMILPLAVHSDIVFGINYRALYELAGKRLCLAAQEEFRLVVNQIKKEIFKVNAMLSNQLQCPCVKTKKCMRPQEYFCGIPLWEMMGAELLLFYSLSEKELIEQHNFQRKGV